jgi:2-dehydro-3-deoxyphosphogluconate aldolase / (4S)-4-hydroxy-2-oxoglutarate aldolase
MTPAKQTLELIYEHRILAILRGCNPEQVLPIAEALYAGGVRLLEITLNSPGAIEAIKAAVGSFGDRMVIGAGTVLEAAEATSAIAAGARFILSPSLDAAVIRRTLDLGAVSIPGAFTPTEILEAWRKGAQIVKVFPASVGPAWFRDIRGPLPQIPLMATGGVSLSSLKDFDKAGAVAFGIGSSLVSPVPHLSPEHLHALTIKAKAFVDTLKADS